MCILKNHTTFAPYDFTYMTFEKKDGVLLFKNHVWFFTAVNEFQPIKLRLLYPANAPKEKFRSLNELFNTLIGHMYNA